MKTIKLETIKISEEVCPFEWSFLWIPVIVRWILIRRKSIRSALTKIEKKNKKQCVSSHA
jgi:hypothetical protein